MKSVGIIGGLGPETATWILKFSYHYDTVQEPTL